MDNHPTLAQTLISWPNARAELSTADLNLSRLLTSLAASSTSVALATSGPSDSRQQAITVREFRKIQLNISGSMKLLPFFNPNTSAYYGKQDNAVTMNSNTIKLTQFSPAAGVDANYPLRRFEKFSPLWKSMLSKTAHHPYWWGTVVAMMQQPYWRR